MPLELIATAGASDANAYVDVSAADAALALRVGAAAWAALTGDQKVQALVTATRDLDTLDWIGARATSTQALEWPRTGTAYSDAVPPPRLVSATIELAFSYAAQFTADEPVDVLSPAGGNIKREKVDAIETEYFAPTTPDPLTASHFPAVVQRLIAPLVRAAAAAQWGTGTAVRTS